MKFRLLGALEIVHGETSLKLGGIREHTLIAALLLRANEPVGVSYLVESVWDRPLASPATNLRSYVSRVRHRLATLPDGNDRLLTRNGGYLLVVHPGELDVHSFENTISIGDRALADDDLRTAVTAYRKALDLWRGEPLEEGQPGPALLPELARLNESHLRVTEHYNEARIRLGEHAAAADDLQRLVARHPLREELWTHLMIALYRSGRRAQALDTYTRARTRLGDELGIEPGPRLRRLHAAILRDDPNLLAPRRTTTPAYSSPPPAQLPADGRGFIGRTDALNRLVTPPRTSAGPAAVVSTIDGMAGVGKTALAVHVAHQLTDQYPDGQLYVDLHGHTPGMERLSLSNALDRLLRALGAPQDRIPDDTQVRVALYRSLLANRRMLVVLDNAYDENQVRDLVPTSPHCRVLITSRRRLVDLDDAHPITLGVLTAPDATALFRHAAGPRSFGAGSGAAALVNEIVELCGRLPLAIRIAAARFRHRPAWTLEELAGRLRDQHHLSEFETPRRSVSAALDLSYHQLPPDEQRMFRLLGLHPGPDFGPHAAAALTRLTVDRAERLVEELLDTHLLGQHRIGRYQFHDLVRTHADMTCAEVETAPQRQEALVRLFDYYVDSTAAAADLCYPQAEDRRPAPAPPAYAEVFLHETQAAAWLDVELCNLLSVAHAGADQSPEHTLRLSATLHHHLRARGRYAEAEALHTQALRTARHVGDRRGELDALNCLGHIHRMQHRQDPTTFEQALTIAREIGDPHGELYALYGLGIVHRLLGRYQAGSDCFQQSLDLARQVGDRPAEVRARCGLGSIHRVLGRYDPARSEFDRALRLARDVGDRTGEINALTGIAVVLRSQRRYRPAGERFEEALAASRDAGHRSGELYALVGLSAVHRARGSHANALDRSRQALRVAEELGDRNGQLEALIGRGHTYLATNQATLAIADHEKAHDLARSLEQPEDTARALHGLAHGHQRLHHTEQARQLWIRATKLLEELDLTEVEEVNLQEIMSRLDSLR